MARRKPPERSGPKRRLGLVRSSDGDDSFEALLRRLAAPESVEDMAEAFLWLQCRLLPGVEQGVLVLGGAEKGPFSAAAAWPRNARPSAEVMQGAERAIRTREAQISSARDTADAPAARGGRTIAHPILVSGRLHGAIALELAPCSDLELRNVQLRVRFGLGWIQAMLFRFGDGATTSAGSPYEVVLSMLAVVLERPDFGAASTSLATELATELGCDRVSIGFVHRNKVRLQALSHTSHVEKRTNLIRSLEAAMDEALDQEATIVYPPPDSVARGTHAHTELARRLGVGSVCTIPLLRGDAVCGAITFERPAQRPFDPAAVALCETIATLVGPALEGSRRESRGLPAKIFEASRDQLAHLVGPRHVALKLAVFVALALLLFLGLARGDYRVTADTVLEPSVLRAVVAPFSGYIESAGARPGDLVREGTVLGTLDDRDLRLEQAKWLSEVERLIKQSRQAMAARDAARAEILAAAVEEARSELRRVEDRIGRTELRASFDGVVVAGDLTQELGAPVERGDVLFEVAPLDAYRVILKVDEHDIADIAVDQAGSILFSSLPGEPHGFVVERITPVATAEEGRNFFRVDALLTEPPVGLRPAIEGVAKIDVDRRRLIWIWTHEAVDWLRLALWRWLP